MSKFISVLEDNDNLNSIMVESEYSLVYYGNIDEFKETSYQENFNYDVAGVYILLGVDRMYIGQSSRSVRDRINSHIINKDWWTNYIIITDHHNNLEKTMVEYMERYLITHLNSFGVHLDNDTLGNSTHINKIAKMKMDRLMKDGISIIESVINVDLYNWVSIKSEVESSSDKYTLNLLDRDLTLSGSSLKKVLIQYLKLLGEDPLGYQSMFESIDEEEDGVLNMVGNDTDIHVIGDIYLTGNLRKDVIERTLLSFLSMNEINYLLS